jgi:hypothetical protein
MFVQNLFSIDLQIAGKELELFFSPEYNRAFNFCWNLSSAGTVKLNDRYSVNAGLAFGSAENVFEIKGFVGGEAALFVNVPLYISLAYNYNGLFKYESHTHSMPLSFSYKGKRVGAGMGINSRFSFFGGSPVFEPMLIASLYVIFIKNDILQIKMEAANFNDFTYGNLGAYFLKLNNIINLSKKFSLINEIELHQSGSIALTSNFYGVAYRGGVRLLW